jgi:hypothetical protein
MVDDYKPILRYGLASGSAKRGNQWIAWIEDNDGLWTSLFTVGELMRYDSLKKMKYSAINIS